MKATIVIDCTPEEARAFMGLPDVKPLQTAVMSAIEKQVLTAADQFSPDAMLRMWFSAMPQVPTQLGDVFTRMMATPPKG